MTSSAPRPSRRIASNLLWTPQGLVRHPLLTLGADGRVLSAECCPDPDRLAATEFYAGLLVPDFPGLPEDGCTITFERDVALSREDAQFVTWEHPLIINGLDLILSGDTGSSTLSLLKNKALPVGTLLLELIYVVEAQAPKQLQLNRFLPATPVRMLLDKNGNNLAGQVEFESFNRQLSAVNRHTGSKLVNAVQQDVHAILQLGEAQVAKAAQALIDAARDEANDKLSAELSRLEALKAVNPNIRDDELSAIESNRQQVMDALAQAGWRLDALRLIVVTHQ